KLLSSYAYKERKHVSNRFRFGESLVGQCALEKKSIVLTNVPGDYVQINSGLGQAVPLNIIVLPVLFEGDVMAIIELASFQPFSEIHRTFLDQLMESIGVVLNMITANMRTEELLEQSQSLTQNLQSQQMELQSQQEQLKFTNTELEEKAKELEEKATQLAEQNNKVELKNREVELARAALEEKAEQLALSSKYKSEFLANMSHELRTPLNSMLILAKLLSENSDGNLTAKQVKFANTIYASGGDLLSLINEILDLSKVEAGKMQIDITSVPMATVQEYVERTFTHVAQEKGLAFQVKVDPDVPEGVATDAQRLQQILRNLLSNAFKFTDQGRVDLAIKVAARDVNYEDGVPVPPDTLVAFEVRDTGIGIPKDKQKLIFEAFQQADGTTSRKYGGTGLGLSISKEITRLLGGRIRVDSEPGKGSVFTLYLPEHFHGPVAPSQRLGTKPDDFAGDEFSTDSFTVNGYSNGSAVADLSPVASLSDRGLPDVSLSHGDSVLHYGTSQMQVQDDRDMIEPGDRVLLIVEDDIHFARILLDIARQQGFKGLVALQGDIALQLAEEHKPDAITLDLKIPRIDGWTVLDRLKRNPQTRHIPVQVISVMDREQGIALGAISYLEKPVSGEAVEGAFAHIKNYIDREVKDLLVVEDDEPQRKSMVSLLSGKDVAVTAVGTAEEARQAMENTHFDCVVLDLSLPALDGPELLKEIKQRPEYQDLPVVIYTGKEISREEELQMKKYAASIITKDTKSADRLLDETSLFLHRVISKMPSAKRKIIEGRINGAGSGPRKRRGRAEAEGNGAAEISNGYEPASRSTKAERDKDLLQELAGRKVLVIDDDYRNIYALASMLESYGIDVAFAENGQEGITSLENTPGIEVVLMDVMMPGMDGYEATQAIRRMEQFRELPIIALTAKAMSGDREKCLAAGASDYIPKPVDADRLLSMIHQWVKPRVA
ncbi:MAG TPA: response regulator, partial [Capsulimonadaceae bacterium]|nr:response regulator [Capsulimonadaceae bacterium]